MSEEYESAGQTPLINMFKTGAVMVFISQASGKALRVLQNGDVDGRGTEDDALAQFRVHVLGPHKVALQNVSNPNYWLRIINNELNGTGASGGGNTEFKLDEYDSRIVFSSVRHSDQRIGIVESGDAKKPAKTGTGIHGQFQPKVIVEVNETIIAGSSKNEELLAHGNIVILHSMASGKNFRVSEDGITFDGRGATFQRPRFIVHVVGQNTIKLQSLHSPKSWVEIKKGELSLGIGGSSSELKVESTSGNLVLESVEFPGNHVAVTKTGDAKALNGTGVRDQVDGQFTVQVMEEQPKYHRAGTSVLERTLHHGNQVLLRSRASGLYLRMNSDGSLQGHADSKLEAQFNVHVRTPGIVALQNRRHQHLYLCIREGELTYGNGGSDCNLKVKDDGDYLLFESVDYPGMHVGMLPNGSIKAPQLTMEGEHGQFTPVVRRDSPFTRLEAQ
jgi:hypothetical protein